MAATFQCGGSFGIGNGAAEGCSTMTVTVGGLKGGGNGAVSENGRSWYGWAS